MRHLNSSTRHSDLPRQIINFYSLFSISAAAAPKKLLRPPRKRETLRTEMALKAVTRKKPNWNNTIGRMDNGVHKNNFYSGFIPCCGRGWVPKVYHPPDIWRRNFYVIISDKCWIYSAQPAYKRLVKFSHHRMILLISPNCDADKIAAGAAPQHSASRSGIHKNLNLWAPNEARKCIKIKSLKIQSNLGD